jgi:WD40 repeat protein
VRRYTGLPAPVNALAFNPNGRTLVAGFGQPNNTVYVWDVATGDQILSLIGHKGAINALAFSPDGDTLLTGSDDLMLFLWDMTNGQPLRRFRGHQSPINTVAFSSDGRTAVSGSDTDGLVVWRIESLDETIAWVRQNREVITLSCSQRTQYNVQPYCIDDVVPTLTPTGTLLPTLTPTITLTPSPAPTATPTPVPMGRISASQGVRLRGGPGTGFAIVTNLSPGTTFIILGSSPDGWINIRLEDGTEGWVLSDAVTPLSP